MEAVGQCQSPPGRSASEEARSEAKRRQSKAPLHAGACGWWVRRCPAPRVRGRRAAVPYHPPMRRRLRSTCKWGGAALTVLLLAVWVGSAWWMIYGEPRDDFGLGIRSGCFILIVDESGQTLSGPRFELARSEASLRWWFQTFWISWSPLFGAAFIPIWFVALLTALPPFWIWRRDMHRPPAGCAQCGYDLRGLDHAVCPECGAAVHRVFQSSAAA